MSTQTVEVHPQQSQNRLSMDGALMTVGWLVLVIQKLTKNHQCTMRDGWWVNRKHFFIRFQFPS
jgi:hypothetical protein